MVNKVSNNVIAEKFDQSQGFLMQEILTLQAEIEQHSEEIRRLDLKVVQLRQEKMFHEIAYKEKNMERQENDKQKNSLSSSINKELFAEETRVIDSINDTYGILNQLVQRKTHMDNLLSCVELVQKDLHSRTIETISNDDYGIKILETQESERKRIARDLHDTSVQNITNLMHKSELCFKLIDKDPVRAKMEIQTMIQTIKTTIKDMRGIIYDLRPMLLDDLGLIPTLERLIREISNTKEIKVSLDVLNDEVKVLSVINLTLYRVVQEATTNAIKHGGATHIKICVEYMSDEIGVTIKDNGTGFMQISSPEKNDKLSGYGLSMMKERVHLLSGEIEFLSEKNKGTEIKVRVPLRTYKEDI